MLHDRLHRGERQPARDAESARIVARRVDDGQPGACSPYPHPISTHLPLAQRLVSVMLSENFDRAAQGTARRQKACGRTAMIRAISAHSLTRPPATAHRLQRRQAARAVQPSASFLVNVCPRAHALAPTIQDLPSLTVVAYLRSMFLKPKWMSLDSLARCRKVFRLRRTTQRTNSIIVRTQPRSLTLQSRT